MNSESGKTYIVNDQPTPQRAGTGEKDALDFTPSEAVETPVGYHPDE